MNKIYVYRGDGFTHSENDDCQKYEVGVETFHVPQVASGRVYPLSDFIPMETAHGVIQAKPLTDEERCQLMCGEYHHKDCPIGEKLRDCWTTPRYLTHRLPLVDIDPCSNPYSSVNAKLHVMLEPVDDTIGTVAERLGKKQKVIQGDGLAISWKGKSVFVNGPFSKLMPWARKLSEAKAFIFLINNVTTTKWYREVQANGGVYKFEFDKRLKFDPPPRIKPSTNNRDQVLICNREGFDLIGNKLDGLGRWWVDYVGYLAR